MLRRVLILTLAAAFIWPGMAIAQEEDETPPMLLISSWQCDFSAMGDISEDWNERGINAARAAVASGSWNDAGTFYHAWSDEWNVNYWATGEDIPALLAGQQTSNETYGESYPDQPSLWEMCREHKDGFYQMGRATEGADDAGEDGAETEDPPMLAISSWKCTDVAAVNEAWDGAYLPKAQAVVDAGEWMSAGVFYHAWADEWNVNFYYIAEDIPQILEGWQSYIQSFDEDSPDITEYCTAHKDGFYGFGKSVGESEDDGGESDE